MRKNQLNNVEQPYNFKKGRRRIETMFSQMCDQFRIRENFDQTFVGFKTRIISKNNYNYANSRPY